MHYPEYIDKGYLIGSGIESAHRNTQTAKTTFNDGPECKSLQGIQNFL